MRWNGGNIYGDFLIVMFCVKMFIFVVCGDGYWVKCCSGSFDVDFIIFVFVVIKFIVWGLYILLIIC